MIAFTRTFGAHSTASVCVRLRRPAFAAPYAAVPGEGRVPLTLAMLMIEPRDVADVCLFLASPLAAYVTGASILVHGGGEKPAFLAPAKPGS